MRLPPFGIVQYLGVRRLFRFFQHLPNFLKLFSRLMADQRVALRVKLVPLGVFAYLLLPADLMPDMLPGFGQVDDIVVILLGLRFFLRLCPPEIIHEHVKAIAAGR
jgi:uncharacterized membrane protein YkvA (DUF1232 family)